MKKLNYILEYAFTENKGRHKIVEGWKCKGIDEVKLRLTEALDLQKGPDGFAVEPDLETLTANLKKYTDKQFIETEYARMTAGWKAYQKLVKKLEATEKIGLFSGTSINVRVDKQNVLSVEYDG